MTNVNNRLRILIREAGKQWRTWFNTVNRGLKSCLIELAYFCKVLVQMPQTKRKIRRVVRKT